ncbi:MAG: putative PEP-binding protein [Arenicellales bacterium WSBS_2016_MAG_OTU3]
MAADRSTRCRNRRRLVCQQAGFIHRHQWLDIQYTLAIDRVDDEVNYLYDPLHPSVLRLIENTIRAADNAGIPVSMCGEMVGDVTYTKLLLGLGRNLRMDPTNLLEVKRCV